MQPEREAQLVSLPTDLPVWENVFLPAPLVLIGTREDDGSYDLAPKHMAMPLGWDNYFAFACTPRHATYGNVQREGAFTVSFPRPSQIVHVGLAASGRTEAGEKPALAALPTFPAVEVEGVLVEGCGVFLECALERVVDGFGENSLIVGRIVAAHADPAVLRGAERDDAELLRDEPLLAYVGPGRFATVGETRSFPYPADFRL